MTEPLDSSPNMHDPRTQGPGDVESRRLLEEYFATSIGSTTEKLENFSKYVPRQSLARFMARYEIFRLILDVQGSIVECGVMLGGGLFSFAKLSTILEPYNFQRRVIGFDTFAGFPSVHEADLRGPEARKSAHLKAGGFEVPGAYEDIERAIAVYDSSRYLNHFPKIELVRGIFEETIDAYLDTNPHLVVSCLYLDFDIYAPTKAAIERLAPRMPRGAVLAFDELNEERFPGETVAALEVFGDLGRLRMQRLPFEPRISFAVLGD